MIQWDLYVVVTGSLGKGRPILELVRQSLAGGATVIQLREKELTTRELVELGSSIRKLTHQFGAAFIVNDRLDIALAVDADGLHIGQEDLPLPVARRLLGPDKVLGLSAGTVAEARQGENEGADYLGVGPFYVTESKKNTGSPIGAEGISAVKAAVDIPVIAIGGLNEANAGAAIAAGADGIAVISAVIGAANISGAAKGLLRRVKCAKAERK